MNKKIIYLLCFISALCLPLSIVNAKSVEELIKEQNPSGLTKNDRISMMCSYTTGGENKNYYGSIPDAHKREQTFKFSIKYNNNSKAAVVSLTPKSTDTTKYTLLQESAFLSNDVYYCPEKVYASYKKVTTTGNNTGLGTSNPSGQKTTVNWSFSASKPSGDYAQFNLVSAKIAGTRENGDSIGNYYPGIKKTEYVCGGVVSDDLLKEINKIYRTISLIVVVAVIILGILDFIKAVSSDEDSALKKAGSKFMKRIIIAVILVILPILLQFILTLFGDENMKQCLDKIK